MPSRKNPKTETQEKAGSDLNPQQEAFVEAYLTCFNATKAAIHAGYSERSAYSTGSRLLKKDEVAARVRARLAEAAMEADEVLFHLAMVARNDLDDVIDENGNLDIKKARATGKTRMIKKIRQRQITGEEQDIFETEIELHDPMRALDLLAKHHNLTNTVRVDDWRSQAIQDIRDRKLTFSAVAKAFDPDLATKLFQAAGVPVEVDAE